MILWGYSAEGMKPITLVMEQDAGYTLDRRQGQPFVFTPAANLESLVHLIAISLNFGRKLEQTQGNHAAMGEHANSTPKAAAGQRI